MQKIATKLVKIMDELAEGEKQKSKNYSNSFECPNGDVLGKMNKLLVKYNVYSSAKSELISMKEITTVEESIEYLVTVSYTHLDVYKRQVQQEALVLQDRLQNRRIIP